MAQSGRALEHELDRLRTAFEAKLRAKTSKQAHVDLVPRTFTKIVQAKPIERNESTSAAVSIWRRAIRKIFGR